MSTDDHLTPHPDDRFDPATGDEHDDFPAAASAVEKVAATLARVRELDGLGATADAERERLEFCRDMADLIECGRSYTDVNSILAERRMARDAAEKLARRKSNAAARARARAHAR